MFTMRVIINEVDSNKVDDIKHGLFSMAPDYGMVHFEPANLAHPGSTILGFECSEANNMSTWIHHVFRWLTYYFDNPFSESRRWQIILHD